MIHPKSSLTPSDGSLIQHDGSLIKLKKAKTRVGKLLNTFLSLCNLQCIIMANVIHSSIQHKISMTQCNGSLLELEMLIKLDN